jgi:hypothetical protein
MKIDKDSWHCKVYLWWYYNKYPAKELSPSDRAYYEVVDPSYITAKTNSNLCPYVRAVVLWAPMRAVFGSWIKVHKKISLNAITIPAVVLLTPLLFSHKITLAMYRFELAILCVMASVVSIITIIYYASKYTKVFYTEGIEPLTKNKQLVTFRGLIKEYLRSAHDRVCPEINWDK